MKYRTDPAMGERLIEEILRSKYDRTELANELGCHPDTINYWLYGGGIPHAYYLAAFHRAGFDVIYILTGERTRNDQTRSENYN